MQRRSILSGEEAMAVSAFTAVSRVISFFSRSRNMGRQVARSCVVISYRTLISYSCYVVKYMPDVATSLLTCWRLSPRCATIWPMQEIALSFTSWSISCACTS